jgi:hypothetical protein
MARSGLIRRLVIGTTSALALILAAGHAQTTIADSGNTSTIAGTVVDATTEQPLRGAQVSARVVPSGKGTNASAASVVADSQGQFKFENLAAGRYLLWASFTGYVNQGPFRRDSRWVSLATGQHIDDILIGLTPGAAISGDIVDSTRRALSGVTVQALKRSDQFGRLEFREVARDVSDKSGEYRLTALSAGKYYLYVIPRAQLKKHALSHLAYVPVYFPPTPDASGSTALMLQPGEQLTGLDIALDPVHTVTIKGRVVDPLSKSAVTDTEVSLREEAGIAAWPDEATVDSKGNFELVGVPPGNYLILVQRQSENSRTMRGQAAVKVGDLDLRNVEVAVSLGIEMSGHVSIDTKANVDLNRLVAILEPDCTSTAAGSAPPEIANASVTAEGRFVFHDVPEGTYHIDFFHVPTGFYLKPPDSEDNTITITRGHGPPNVELVLSPGAASIAGTITKDQRPLAWGAVVLVPEGERRRQSRYYRQTIADREGRFMVQNIVPGDYKVLAWHQTESGPLPDTELLQQFEDQAKVVRLKDGDSVSMQLEVVSQE